MTRYSLTKAEQAAMHDRAVASLRSTLEMSEGYSPAEVVKEAARHLAMLASKLAAAKATTDSEAEQCWTIQRRDDYGVWETVAVVLGTADRAREIADAREADDEPHADGEARFAFEAVELLR